jgi:hypothetical protein
MSVPPDRGSGSLFSHGGTRAIREVLLPGRPSGGDPAVQPLDPDQGLSVAPTARLGQFELARGERQVLECPAQEHGRVDVSAAVAHTGQRRVDGGEVAALPASTPTEAARVWGRRRVGWVTATGSTRIRRAAPPVAAGKRVRDVLHLSAALADQFRGPPAAVVFDHPHAAKPAGCRCELPAFCVRQRQREHPATVGEPGGVLLPERDRGQPGARAVFLAVPGNFAARSSTWPGRPRGGATGPAPGTDLFVPRQPLLPVRPEQPLQAERVPRQRRGQICLRNVIRLLRRALAKVCPDLVQQDVVRRAGGAAVAAEQFDLSRRRLQAQFSPPGSPPRRT